MSIITVAEAVRRVRETVADSGDADLTAWACAAQLDTEELRRIAAVWLVEAARNAERAEVRATERASKHAMRHPVPQSPVAVDDETVRARQAQAEERRRQWAAEDAAINKRFRSSMDRILQDYAANLRAEWTRELLDRAFVVNGKRVTWGDATVADHQARAEDFAKRAVANSEGAALHLRAVADLEAAGAATLNDLASVAA